MRSFPPFGRIDGPGAGRRPGFTLIELLATIGIISVLASLLLPALGRVRDSARVTICQGQLRGFAAALIPLPVNPPHQRDGDEVVEYLADQLNLPLPSPLLREPQRLEAPWACPVDETWASSHYGFSYRLTLPRQPGRVPLPQVMREEHFHHDLVRMRRNYLLPDGSVHFRTRQEHTAYAQSLGW